MAEDADHLQAPDALQARGLREDPPPVGGRDTAAREAGVDLDVHARDALRRCRSRCRLELLEARDAELDAGGDRIVEAPPRGVQPREQRRGDACPPQRERLVDIGDAQARRAAGEGGDGRRDRTVPVAVGLDHGEQLGACQPPQVPHVLADRRGVDARLAEGGAHPDSSTTKAAASPASCVIVR